MVDTGKSKKSSNLVKVAETAEASEGVKTATIEAAGGKTTAAATHAVRVRGGKATPLTLCGFLSRLSTLSFHGWTIGHGEVHDDAFAAKTIRRRIRQAHGTVNVKWHRF